MTGRALLGLGLLWAGLLWLGLLGACTGGPAPDAGEDAPATVALADGCMACHLATQGPPGIHAAGGMGCAACHLGDPAATEKEAAHRGLEREPGALDTVDQTCGSASCHAAESARVASSLMATGAGLVAVDRQVLGEVPTPGQTLTQVRAAAAPTPAEDHLRRLCAGCHLGTRADNRDDAVVEGGSGCGACHVAKRAGAWDPHPAIDSVPPDGRCLGCHSRSGRISLGTQGLSEALGAPCEDPVALFDGRSGCRGPADIHHQAGLSCVDCHLHTELMGDGTAWAHEEQAVEIRCESCHGPDPAGAPQATWAQVQDPISRILVRQHGQTREPTEAVRLGSRGTPLWNLRPAGAGWALTPKAGGTPIDIRPTPADATHQQPGHTRLSCSACHTLQAPTCPACHTRYEVQGEQWDFGRGALAPGRWIEEGSPFGMGSPALGIGVDGRIGPMVPGMILDVDATAAGGGTLSARRFAATAPHTTQRQGRSCESCHARPEALGLGTGSLDLQALRFTPAVPDPSQAGRALDGWVGLQPERPGEGTRPAQRSLDATEQRRVLRMGLCLPCHEGTDAIYADLDRAVARLRAGGSGCRFQLPGWVR